MTRKVSARIGLVAAIVYAIAVSVHPGYVGIIVVGTAMLAAWLLIWFFGKADS